MRIKCVKIKCLVCDKNGSTQLFLNKQNQIRYARTRHYSHIDKTSKKPQFTYCKIENLDSLETLLNKGKSLNTDKATLGQLGQRIHDLKLRDSSLISQNSGARSSARIEHHPPKVGVVGSNPTSPAEDKPRTLRNFY